MAPIVDGTFAIDPNGFVQVIAAPAWSRAAINYVQQSLQEAARRPSR